MTTGAGSHATFTETPKEPYAPGKTVEYCCGLLYNRAGTRVVMIRKNRPAWQAGLLNGVGGKIESHEAPREAMSREFQEEAGLSLSVDGWELAVVLTAPAAKVSFFRRFTDNAVIDRVRTMTDERVIVCSVSDGVPYDVVPNMRWLVPFCADPCAVLPIVVLDAPSSRWSADR